MTEGRLGWDEREQRLLEAVADAEVRGDLDYGTDQLAEDTGIEMRHVQRGLLNLRDADYLTGIDAAAEEECYLLRIRLLERGYRAVRQWPAEDRTGDELLALIEQRAEATDDPEERTRLQRLGDSVRGAGTATMQQLLVAYLRHMAGI